MSAEISRRTGEQKTAALESVEGRMLLATLEPNPDKTVGGLLYKSDDDVLFGAVPELALLEGSELEDHKLVDLRLLRSEKSNLLAYLRRVGTGTTRNMAKYRSIAAEVRRRWEKVGWHLSDEDIARKLEERIAPQPTGSEVSVASANVSDLSDWNEKHGHDWFENLFKNETVIGSRGTSEPGLPDSYSQPRPERDSGIPSRGER